MEFALEDNNLRFGSVSIAGDPQIGTNSWHHVAATYDGAEAKVYLDGVLRASQSYTRHVDPKRIGTSTDILTLTPLMIGGELLGQLSGDNSPLTVSGRPFLGRIDELRVYARALTSDEISSRQCASIWMDSKETDG